MAVNPHSSLDGLQVVLPELAMVLLMTVNPGFGGQRFIEAVVPKIRALRDEITRRGLDVDIEVDGGIAADTAPTVVGGRRQRPGRRARRSSSRPPRTTARPSPPCAPARRGRR